MLRERVSVSVMSSDFANAERCRQKTIIRKVTSEALGASKVGTFRPAAQPPSRLLARREDGNLAAQAHTQTDGQAEQGTPLARPAPSSEKKAVEDRGAGDDGEANGGGSSGGLLKGVRAARRGSIGFRSGTAPQLPQPQVQPRGGATDANQVDLIVSGTPSSVESLAEPSKLPAMKAAAEQMKGMSPEQLKAMQNMASGLGATKAKEMQELQLEGNDAEREGGRGVSPYGGRSHILPKYWEIHCFIPLPSEPLHSRIFLI